MTAIPTVLFVGDDASSTQIAESLLRRLVGDRVEVHTAGAQQPNPGGREDQMLVMMGLNPAHEERLSVRALNSADRVIVLGTNLDVARIPGRRYEEWDVTRDSLEDRVENLAAELLDSIDGVDSQGLQPGRRRHYLVTAQQVRRHVAAEASRRLRQVARAIARRR